MIKLAFSTLGCPSWPLGRILDSASRLGYYHAFSSMGTDLLIVMNGSMSPTPE